VPLWKKVGVALLSTLLALVLAELIATWVMGGAYPYLNIYVSDPVLGVRLLPEASTTIESPLGRTTEVETNTLGFRGAVLGDGPAKGRVLVVGDSQVMAYGVDEADGFVSRLDQQLDLMGAGIPTWGPAEYSVVARELVERFRPAVLVVVINAVNDWNEADFPNVGRTAERDGWAVGLAPGQVLEPITDFPLRHFLMSRSHLVLAARLLLHGNPHERAIAPALTFVSQAEALGRAMPPWRSKLGPHLAEIHATCQRAGCRVLTVALPADVMVDAAEWAKYRKPGETALAPANNPAQAAAVAALMQGLATDALTLHERAVRRVGGGSPTAIPGYLDLTRALVAASPGAFLPDDFHLSERGHEAVAKALAPLIETLLGLPAPQTPDQDPAQ
jgi:hypothetical protein